MKEILKTLQASVEELVAQRPLPEQEELDGALDVITQLIMKTYTFNVQAGNGQNAQILVDALATLQIGLMKYPMEIERLRKEKALIEEQLS